MAVRVASVSGVNTTGAGLEEEAGVGLAWSAMESRREWLKEVSSIKDVNST
jgi:hypothetical protein